MTSNTLTRLVGEQIPNSSLKAGNTKSGNTSDAFSRMLDKVSGSQQKNIADDKDQYTQAAANHNKSKVNDAVKDITQTDKKRPVDVEEAVSAKAAEEAAKGNPMDDNDEAVTDAIKDIQKEILDSFDVTEEELTAAMETLGLTMIDLLDPQVMVSLAVELTGSGDAMALVTNEALYTDVKGLMDSITDITANLMRELNMDPQEFQDMLSAMKEQEAAGLSGQDSILQTETMEEPVLLQEMNKEAPAAGEGQKAVYGQQDVKNQTTEPVTNGSKQEADTADSADVQRNAQQGEQQKDTTGQGQNGNGEETLLQTMQNQIKEHLEATVKTTDAAPPKADVESIMKQINQQIKLMVKPDMTEISIRLHPESLGNIHLQVAAKNGMVTAQLAAENEAVKAVIESQVVMLRDAMNEQGLKVEAVEVTVASHEFERNLEQQQDDGTREEQKSNSGRKVNLNRNLMSDEGLTDDLTQADKIAVEMMTQNGNSVDFIA